MNLIYLDHSTTTPIAASVLESMQPFFKELYGHPSSTHWMGRAAAEAIEDARSHVATLLECHPSEIIFTSGGTESVNLGLLGVGHALSRSHRNPHCIISNLEHVAVRHTANQMQRLGWRVSTVNCNSRGTVEPADIARLIDDATCLISIIHASSELGTIQPIEEISRLCAERNIILHTDAAQSVGKIPCHVESLGVDLLSLSGHKFHAPKGVGALYSRLGVFVEPLGYGEWFESGLRPGTPNVAQIAALGQAAKLAQSRLESSIDRISSQRDQFHSKLQSLIGKSVPILGRESARLPGSLTMLLPHVNAEQLQQRLPEICFGPLLNQADETGSDQVSPFACLGLSPQEQAGVIRVGIGWTTSDEELNQAAHRMAACYESLCPD
jgi:cysteine desulfurase